MCPHCGRPGLYPNVADAEDDTERDALERRYHAALTEASARGAAKALKGFEAVAAKSKAVLTRSLGDLLRLAKGDNLFATYYQVRGDVSGAEWDLRRTIADAVLFPGYHNQITIAALSLDESGLSRYGSCSIVLRNDMIAHRATVFEENSILFAERHRLGMEKGRVRHGYRAPWHERGKLCATKLHRHIGPDTVRDEYAALLMHEGATSEDDQFVEVHIFGPVTMRTIEQVSVRKPRKGPDKVSIRWLEQELKKFGVTVKTK